MLTLIITLKDRANFTKRVCHYLSTINYPFEVFFADGSLENENENFLKKNAKEFNFQYRYFRYPKDESLSLFYAKCADIISKVTTSYVMLADNDDFPIISGQEKAIEFLEKKSDYVGCNGRVAGVALSPDSSRTYGKHAMFLPYYCYDMDKPVNLEQGNSIERIRSFLTNFNSIYYSVFRTDSLKITLTNVRKLNFSDLGIYELYFSYSQLAQGKIKNFPELTYIRQKGSSQIASTQWGWIERLFYTNWMDDLKKALKEVSAYISKNESLNEDIVHKTLYKDFVEKQKKRFIPNNFYFLNNWGSCLNKERLVALFSSIFFRFFPSYFGRYSRYLLKRTSSNEELNKVVACIEIRE